MSAGEEVRRRRDVVVDCFRYTREGVDEREIEKGEKKKTTAANESLTVSAIFPAGRRDDCDGDDYHRRSRVQ